MTEEDSSKSDTRVDFDFQKLHKLSNDSLSLMYYKKYQKEYNQYQEQRTKRQEEKADRKNQESKKEK